MKDKFNQVSRFKRGAEAWIQTKLKNEDEFYSELHSMGDNTDEKSSDISFYSNRDGLSVKDNNNLILIPASVFTKCNDLAAPNLDLNDDSVVNRTIKNPMTLHKHSKQLLLQMYNHRIIKGL